MVPRIGSDYLIGKGFLFGVMRKFWNSIMVIVLHFECTKTDPITYFKMVSSMLCILLYKEIGWSCSSETPRTLSLPYVCPYTNTMLSWFF